MKWVGIVFGNYDQFTEDLLVWHCHFEQQTSCWKTVNIHNNKWSIWQYGFYEKLIYLICPCLCGKENEFKPGNFGIVFFTKSEITNFNGICNGNIRSVRNYWLIKPVWTGLSQFVHSCQKLLINRKGVVEQNYKFLWFPAQLYLNIIC